MAADNGRLLAHGSRPRSPVAARSAAQHHAQFEPPAAGGSVDPAEVGCGRLFREFYFRGRHRAERFSEARSGQTRCSCSSSGAANGEQEKKNARQSRALEPWRLHARSWLVAPWYWVAVGVHRGLQGARKGSVVGREGSGESRVRVAGSGQDWERPATR